MRLRFSWSDLALGVLAVCAIVTTVLVVRREFSTSATQRLSAFAEQPDWRTHARQGHRLGNTEAKVTITTFSDFQCPYCKVHAARLDTLRTEFGSDVALVFRHHPLRIHRFAVTAAKASECAGEQDRFWAFHDALFARQDSIGSLNWRYYADAAEVPDLQRFDACVATRQHFPNLERDTATARRLALNGTPVSLVNGQIIRGAMPLDVFRDAVRGELRR